MYKIIFTFAGFSGLVAVALGAFAAHGLKGKLDQQLLHAFETGVNYQMFHTLVLLQTCFMIQQWGKNWALEYASYAFAMGILLFSGSLYLLALTSMKWLGPITPLGGLFFILGWALLALGIWQHAH